MAADGEKEKRILIPRACERCSRIPWLYGMLRAKIRASGREICNLSVDTTTFFVDGKPVHQAEVNRNATKGDTFSARDFIWLDNIGLIHHLEQQKTWFHSWFIGRRRFAGTWEDCVPRKKKRTRSEEAAPLDDRGPVARLWDKIALLSAMCRRAGGLFPQSLLVSDHRIEDTRLVEVDNPMDVEAEGAGLFPSAEAPPGGEVRAVYRPTAVRIGPLLGNPTVWSSKAWQNRMGCVIYRSKPKAVYDANSVSAGRLSAWMQKFKREVFSPQAIKEAYIKVLKEYPTSRDLVSKKFTQQQIDDIRRRLGRAEVVDGKVAGHGRKAIVKHEMVAKKKKPPRAVIDEGPDLLVINSMVSRIFEMLIFDKEIGIFYRLSIKHRARNDVLNALQEEWTRNNWADMAAAEVDQTAMELHERYSPVSGGVLGPIYHILGIIAKEIDGLPRTETVRHMINNIQVDADRGVKVTYRLRLQGRSSNVRLHYEDIFMCSGWRLTSAVNFVNELAATLVVFLDNPERVFLRPRRNAQNMPRFLIQHDTFNFWFEREIGGVLKAVRFRPYVEGDDVLAAVSSCFIPIVEEIEQRYGDLGYSAKLKILHTGRAEFIGAHFLLEQGRLVSTWMPALGRYLCKLGVMASNNISKESIVARCCSIAVMFAGKLPTVAIMFQNLAESHLEGCDLDFIIRPEQYSEEERTFGVDEITLREVLRKTCQAILVPGPDMGAQLRLVQGSLDADVTSDELAWFYQLAPRMSKDLRDVDAFGFLPACLREP